MLTIRKEQVDAFRQEALLRFENKMVAELRKFFPQTAEKLGEPGLREVIQHGLRRAGEYGIVRERDVGRYVAIAMMFGPNFDQKTSSGVMYSVLRDPRFRDSRARTDALCRYALRGLRRRTLRTGRKPAW
jgi:hypothetical protein